MNLRPDLSTEQKVGGNRTTYKPLVMSDASVYEMATHNFTVDEVADAFSVSRNTVLDLHGDAYNKGRNEAKLKPRIALRRIISAFELLEDTDFLHKDVPVERLLKALELHARKYEGLGSKQELEVTHKEPPSPADLKFKPLTVDNYDKAWKPDSEI